MTQPRIVCIAGAIGSGKTTVSTAVSRALGWSRAGFGDYVRWIASKRGLDQSRKVLQRIGEEEINGQGWDGFCAGLLNWSGWTPGQPMVLDGLRHAEILHSLRRIVAPMSASLVFLRVGEVSRAMRLAERDDQSGMRSEVAANSTEVQVQTILQNAANLCVDAERPYEAIVEAVINWLGDGNT